MRKGSIILFVYLILVLSLTQDPVMAQQNPTIVVLANSIDYDLSSDFLGFLSNNGIDKIRIETKDFDQYQDSKFIIMLGGPDAYEGVGEIVQQVLTPEEQNYLRTQGNRKMYVKTNVWATGQVVAVVAGSDRQMTQKAHQNNREGLLALDSDNDGENDLIDIEPLKSKTGTRRNPASIGDSLIVVFEEFLDENYEARITVLDVIRGAQAWTRIQDANMFNDPPNEGFEYILVKIKFEYTEGPGPDTTYDVNGFGFDVISSEGKEYEDPSVVDPEPRLDARLYPGAAHEGWAAYQVAVNDNEPLLTFGRDYRGRGGVWFKLYY